MQRIVIALCPRLRQQFKCLRLILLSRVPCLSLFEEIKQQMINNQSLVDSLSRFSFSFSFSLSLSLFLYLFLFLSLSFSFSFSFCFSPFLLGAGGVVGGVKSLPYT